MCTTVTPLNGQLQLFERNMVLFSVGVLSQKCHMILIYSSSLNVEICILLGHYNFPGLKHDRVSNVSYRNK